MSIDLWRRYRQHLCKCPSLGISVDISRMNFGDDFFKSMTEPMANSFNAMKELEGGAIANPDEGRMVGHYWLRAPELAPTAEISSQITVAKNDVINFAKKIHAKEITPPTAAKFTDVLLIGIGGSALGPQLVADAMKDAGGAGGKRRDKMRLHFFDNTDPDGIDREIQSIGSRLKSTLVVVISKSGGTKETRNGMLEATAVFERASLDISKQAVAVTGEGSELFQHAKDNDWIDTFPMWDWVGGRTSVLSAVGLLPAALQGIDVEQLLAGAAEMDRITRETKIKKNPAALLALMWHYATNGCGEKDMVVLPYKDRLLLMSRYLQQLIMESIGKKHDLDGEEVFQGIAVYGNKGSTDQHAFVQQLRDGVVNFFATFIVVLQDRPRSKDDLEVEANVTSGDYLNGFWQGTREALHGQDRESITITMDRLNAKTFGALIALYERAVGLYATLVNINAYHQPGVQAGKEAADEVLGLQGKVIAHMDGQTDTASPEDIAEAIGEADRVESVFHVLEHLNANKRVVVRSGRKYRKR